MADDKYRESLALYERANIIPGRGLTRSKSPGAMYPHTDGPLYATHGEGCSLYDADGNRFIDMLCALGAISLGYGYGIQLKNGARNVMSLPSVHEVRAAELMLKHVAPWATSIRFVKTGSEATHAALMVARAMTGRRPFARLRGSYHGWHDEWSNTDNPNARWFDLTDSFDALRATFVGCAAVFVEPPRWQPFEHAQLDAVWQAASDESALIVMDEMIYGGRWALGGATEYFGLVPDLACFGKALGNGAPIACVVGQEELSRHGTLVSGTYSGDPAALDALCSVLHGYQLQDVIGTIWARGRQLQRGLRAITSDSRTSGFVFAEGAAVHQRLRFVSPGLGKLFSAAMAKRGVIWHPDCVNVCAAHSMEDIETVIVAAEAALQEVLH